MTLAQRIDAALSRPVTLTRSHTAPAKMGITRKIDRAFQWAGEKMGAEAKTTMGEEFKMLETEMALRHDGMDRLQRSMTAYVKAMGRRSETMDDKEKGLPVGYLGRTMLVHGEDFEPDSEFGNCLIAMGRANERISVLQENYVADATTAWLEGLDRSLAMMKEYQSARKKLENRRLAYDSSTTKLAKAKREDFRLEEDLRTCKAKYEESSEDVVRRMQDIKDAEADSVRDLTHFLDAELEYYERCAEELRRVRRNWAVETGSAPYSPTSPAGASIDRRPVVRSRSSTTASYTERLSRTNSHTRALYEAEELEPEPEPERRPIRTFSRASASTANTHYREPPEVPAGRPVSRPGMARANTYQGREERVLSPTSGRFSGNTTPSYAGGATLTNQNVSTLRHNLRPVGSVGRINTAARREDVFADRDDDTGSDSGSPEWGDRSASPATSFGSLTRSTSNLAVGGGALQGGGATERRKAPPPPPPSRAKKPPPPVPAKRELGY